MCSGSILFEAQLGCPSTRSLLDLSWEKKKSYSFIIKNPILCYIFVKKKKRERKEKKNWKYLLVTKLMSTFPVLLLILGNHFLVPGYNDVKQYNFYISNDCVLSIRLIFDFVKTLWPASLPVREAEVVQAQALSNNLEFCNSYTILPLLMATFIYFYIPRLVCWCLEQSSWVITMTQDDW